MKISELKPGMAGVDVEGEIIDKEEPRQIEKFGRRILVCTAKLKDDSGEIDLTLWNEDINKYNVGDKVKIARGFIREFNGVSQLTSGKFGTIEKI